MTALGARPAPPSRLEETEDEEEGLFAEFAVCLGIAIAHGGRGLWLDELGGMLAEEVGYLLIR